MQTELLHWISTFLEAQAAELGAATNTQLAYGRDLKDFDSFLARRALDFVRVGRKDIEAYLIWCDAQGLAKSTRARRGSENHARYPPRTGDLQRVHDANTT